MNSAYRILKLKSGEELIAKILKKENDKVVLESPMIFRTLLMTDPYTGMQKELTILKDWIINTIEKEIKIPQDYIITYSVPAEEATQLYDKEKEKKETNKHKKKLQNFDSIKNDMQKEADNAIQSLLDSLIQKKKTDEGPLFFNTSTDEILKNMMDSMEENGEFEFEFEFTYPMEEISDETTESDIDHPDYGNRWTDWSSDISDY